MSFTAARGLQTRWWIGLPLFKICYSINHWCVLWITGVTVQGQGLDCSGVLMQRDGTSIHTCARAIYTRFKQTWQAWFMATHWYPAREFSQMMPRAQEVGACRTKQCNNTKTLSLIIVAICTLNWIEYIRFEFSARDLLLCVGVTHLRMQASTESILIHSSIRYFKHDIFSDQKSLVLQNYRVSTGSKIDNNMSAAELNVSNACTRSIKTLWMRHDIKNGVRETDLTADWSGLLSSSVLLLSIALP